MRGSTVWPGRGRIVQIMWIMLFLPSNLLLSRYYSITIKRTEALVANSLVGRGKIVQILWITPFLLLQKCHDAAGHYNVPFTVTSSQDIYPSNFLGPSRMMGFSPDAITYRWYVLLKTVCIFSINKVIRNFVHLCTRVGWKVHRLTTKELCHSNETWHGLNSPFPDTNCIVSFR